MAGPEDENQGLLEAHTAPENSAVAADPERAAKVGSTRATTEAVMADLAAQLVTEDEAEQPSLMLDDQDEQLALFAGPVAHVASAIAASRGRGRPKGSPNKANELFRDTLMRMGYRHPGLNLAALANANPVTLSEELSRDERDDDGVVWRGGCTPLEAMQLILKANAELLPYFESKRPTEIHVDKKVLGVMFVGEMEATRPDDEGVIDITRAPSPE